MSNQGSKRFPTPFEVTTPVGADGWESMYPYYYLFSADRKDHEMACFWFHDSMHHPEPLHPFDAIIPESWWVGLGQNNTRIFIVPPALGLDQRVVNGYLYISPLGVDPSEIEGRVPVFMKRAGYYFENWNKLYDQWKAKAEEAINEVANLQIPSLPKMEDEAVVTEARGIATGYRLIEAYNRLIENCHRMWQLHFEFLNLGYAAYLTYYDFCKKAFPGISDQNVARMVAGIDVILFRPDTELKKLAQLAVKLDVVSALQAGSIDGVKAAMGATESGRQWLAAFERAQHPWFNFSNASGMAHHHRSWIDDLNVPLTLIKQYADRAARGEDIDRPTEEVARQRDEITAEYSALLQSEEDKKGFNDLLGLARTVFPYVEEHNFFVEHWHHTIFWNKVRQVGAVLAEQGFIADQEDIFYLNRYEISQALYDAVSAWACGGQPRGPKYWPPILNRRKEMWKALAAWSPPPALGEPPENITEPFTVMLWGITSERVKDWLSDTDESGNELRGFPGSPGAVEGKARVVMNVEQLGEVQEGEILVCPITTPSWAPIFSKIQAVVTDIGGIMSHAAIVCREYGVPAVVGTGYGTKTFKTGQRLKVDGFAGTVTALD